RESTEGGRSLTFANLMGVPTGG
ncbi:MAG: hypothetical protein RI908_1148, partial [Actinomycetota bacterium]